MNGTERFFAALPSLALDEQRLVGLRKTPDPATRVIIAITPRSGSSYLCDLMKRAGCFGVPNEYLLDFVLPESIKNIPARSADEYLSHMFRRTTTPNGVATLKTSWFCFQNFIALLADRSQLTTFKYIMLTREDTAAQAVSLYKATESNIFHSDVDHTEAERGRLERLNYSFEKINRWHEHIIAQEVGWRDFFKQNRLSPLLLRYEDIDTDPGSILQTIAAYVGVDPRTAALPDSPSLYRKLSDDRSIDWTNRFRIDQEQGQLRETRFRWR